MKNDRSIPVGICRRFFGLEEPQIGGCAIGTNPRHPSVFRFICAASLEGAVKDVSLGGCNAQILSAVIKPVTVLMIYDGLITRFEPGQQAVHAHRSVDASPILSAQVHAGLCIDDTAGEFRGAPRVSAHDPKIIVIDLDGMSRASGYFTHDRPTPGLGPRQK